MKLNESNRTFIKMISAMLEYSKTCALHLEELAASFDHVHERVEKIDMLESEADHLLHQFIKELSASNLKGRHKDKLMTLASMVDDVTDSIEQVANTIEMYSISSIDDSVSELCALLVRATEMLIKASYDFPSRSENLIRCIIEVNRLEETADRVYHSAMASLFSSSSSDALSIIKLKELYSSLEECLNAAEAVADEFDSLTVVYS